MVSRRVLLTLVLGLAAPASAQQADWSRAGGALFAAPAESGLPSKPGDPSPDVSVPPPVQPYGEAIAVAATRHGLDPKLLHALVVVESAYRNEACSPAGACGLTQLMPRTALDLGVTDRFRVEANLAGGADYLARQLLRFGDLRLALAAYNAGPERVARLGRVPAIPETRAYVAAVIECYLALSAGRSVRSARDCVSREGAA